MPSIEGVDLPETIPCRSGGSTGGGCDEDESKVFSMCRVWFGREDVEAEAEEVVGRGVEAGVDSF